MSKRIIGGVSVVAGIMLALAQTSGAQSMPLKSSVFVPASSVVHPGHAHTNVLVKVFPGMKHGLLQAQPFGQPFPSSEVGFYETPASLACIYHLVHPIVAGCNPDTVSKNPSGGSNVIAIVDAYDDSANAMSDLNTFSTQFGLPAANFSVVYVKSASDGGGVATAPPPQDPTGGWEVEEALDTEMVHAMAPGATIILVEAASDLTNPSTGAPDDLLAAVDVASSLVHDAGGGEVSMSWGGFEYSDEVNDDSHFTTPGVVYIASTGDSPGTEYPSASPNVIAAGGTAVRRNPFNGTFLGQDIWQETGDGPSNFELRPGYQNGVQLAFPKAARGARNVPDLAFDSDPDTGVWVYDSFSATDGTGVGGTDWFVYGGTSVAAQTLAGTINRAGHFAASSRAELRKIYNNISSGAFFDIASGYCGFNDGWSAKTGWDYCSGVGTPDGYAGK